MTKDTKDTSLHNPHDSSYKALFSHSEMVADLLTGYVKEPWVEQLDLSTLVSTKDSYVSDDFRHREADVVWRVRWLDPAQEQEQWFYIYLLLEFQSTVDKFMPLRLNIYSSLLLDDLRKQNQLTPNGKLPPVFPLVLYNGARPWTAPWELSELIDSLPGQLHRYQPNIRYVLLAESAFENEPLPEVKNLVSALFALENSKGPESIQAILPLLIEWLDQPEQASLRQNFITWINRVLLTGRFPGVQWNKLQKSREEPSMLAEKVISWTEGWKQEGLEQGLQQGMERGLEQGREQGREQGIVLGKAKTLRHLLDRRFGPLSEEVEEKISQATEQQLESWLDNILDAQSLDDLFPQK